MAPRTVDGIAAVVHPLRLAAGPRCWALVEHAFRDACGPAEGPAAARHFLVLLQALALGARRPLRLGRPGTAGLTHDECALLQVVAAARREDAALLAAGAAWLVRPAAAAALDRSVRGFAAQLAAAGIALPLPPPPRTAQRPHPIASLA